MGAGHTTPAEVGCVSPHSPRVKNTGVLGPAKQPMSGMLLSKKYHTGVSMILCCLFIFFAVVYLKIYIYM